MRNAVFLASGNAFQDFFARFMACVHGDAFVPIESYGNRGDGGLDGYHGPNGTVYQCYGASSGPAKDRDLYVAKKIEADFATARKTVPDMKSWRFVHNLNALPTKSALALQAATDAGRRKGIAVSHFGFESFRAHLKDLSEQDLEYLLGIRALEEMERASLPDVVNGMIFEVMERAGRLSPAAMTVGTVSFGKMEFNGIPNDWQVAFLQASFHSETVAECIEGFGDPRASVEVPNFFRSQYVDLRTQGLDPGTILQRLIDMLARPTDPAVRLNAARSLVGTMFEGCVIFEEPPAGWVPSRP
ncbi:ABC-three component system protein [Aureimonas sp. SK2]|uniref:ABC-three component system protein n=1 Tax=Aureimonas sp. SK2 TaxID=3015992 RepID=UPI0024438227|nr:ABC-three component system protein [Aureimonas sp. SK2]